MKSAVILGFAAQALAAAVQLDGRPGQGDRVATRTFEMPEFPGSHPYPPTRHAEADLAERDSQDWGGEPDKDKIQIIGLTYGGTGCPSQTVSSILSDDKQIMTLIFDQYVASIGPDVKMTENRKNCVLNINIRYPGGFQFSIFSADYRGYAHLEKGVSGTQKSTYYFSGQVPQTSTETSWKGPFTGDFHLRDQAPVGTTIWSPCGENGLLNINSQIRLNTSDPKAKGIMTNDSLDASFKQEIHFRWQECKKK